MHEKMVKEWYLHRKKVAMRVEILLPLECDQEQNPSFLLLNSMSSSIIIGWREWVSLPELGIPRLKTKVDTGARTSALHALCVEIIEKARHQKQVCFIIQPQPKRFPEKSIKCIADLIDIREITDSGGHKEIRCVIQTSVVLGTLNWAIEITLTSRDNMRFRMLLGRPALVQRFLVDPPHSYLYSKKTIIP